MRFFLHSRLVLNAMRFAPPSLKSVGASSVNTIISSSRFNVRYALFCNPMADRGHGAFVSGDSWVPQGYRGIAWIPQSYRDANYGFHQGYWGDAWIPHGAPPPHFLPPPPRVRPPPPPRPADFRDWRYSLSQPPPQCERFIVLSYNILADYLARDHRSKLYYHIPHHILDWEWRKRRLLIEFGLWDPDIMCLQEVDRFHDLEEKLAVRGYTGIWKMRTGNAVDGCAMFWRTNRFRLRHEEHIEFSKLGLRDNVAQICVLESRIQSPVENASASLAASSDQERGANQVVICNIHVLYNPKRGEIKLGQVRVLLDRAYAISRIWNDAPVIVCGDFNSTPKSPLYNFISTQKLSLSGLTRDQVSGQYSSSIYAPRTYIGSGLYRGQPSGTNSSEVGLSSDMAFKEAVVDESELDKLIDAAATEISSSKMVSETFPPNVEPSTLQREGNPSADLTTEQKGGLVISSNITCGSDLSDLSACSTSSLDKKLVYPSLNEVEKIVIEDSSSDVDHGTINSSAVTLPCIKDNVSSYDISYCNKVKESDSDEGSQSPVKSACSDGLLSNLLEDRVSYRQGDNLINGLCSSEENSDPNFFKELLGTEDACEYSEEVVPLTSSGQIQMSSVSIHEAQSSDSYLSTVEFREDSSPPMDPHTADLEKSYHNPYLWTPMEIEVASGSAECTLIKHSLNLRSTYADVEDYAGTKDSSREPDVTSYNRQFMGTVDYIWCSEGLQTVKVLDTIPKHVLQRTPGFPTHKWGSDHIALACQLAFTKGFLAK